MNRFTLAGITPNKNEDTMPDPDDYDDVCAYADAVENCNSSAVGRVIDVMGSDATYLCGEHALRHISDESFRLLMDYLSKYDAMLRGEV